MASRSPDGGGRSGISGWAQSLPLTYAVIDVPAQNGPPILSIGYAGGINNASQLVGSFAIIDANSAYVEHGFVLPDTPVMAIHRGRIDLLAAHVDRDPSLLSRTFSYAELFPVELKCAQPLQGGYDERLPRTPVSGGTLLHLCVEFDELEIAEWLLARGMNPDVPAAVDANGFGGHTSLFNAVVSYPHFWMNFTGGWAHSRKPLEPKFAKLLLDHGADPNARASFRIAIGSNEQPAFRDFHDVTPHEWGEVFPNKMIVNGAAMELLVNTTRSR